jgi:hypothetical protein
MLQYDPRKKVLPGDEMMRACTQQNKADRDREKQKRQAEKHAAARRLPRVPVGEPVSWRQLQELKKDRLCGPLDTYFAHADSKIQCPKGQLKCVVCGEKTASFRCGLCPGRPAMHWKSKSTKSTHGEKACMVKFHNDNYFGLCYCDHKMRRIPGPYKEPTEKQIRDNKRHIEGLKERHEKKKQKRRH